jgi:hypothetical protein
MSMTKHEADRRHPTLALMKPGDSFEISNDPDELRHLRNAIARFRDTMRFSVRKHGGGYRYTCVADLLEGGQHHE